MILDPTEFPLDGRFEARLQLASQAPTPAPSMQAVDGRGGFSQSFRVATFAEASSRGIDNPYVIKVPFATWLVRVALPAPAAAGAAAAAAATATLAIAPCRATFARGAPATQHRDSLELQSRASSTGKCLATRVIAPTQGEALFSRALGSGLRAARVDRPRG